MEKNKIILDFCIWGFDDITHNEITQIIGVTPIKLYIKGEKRNPNLPNSNLIDKNGWRMASPLSEYCTFEQQMNAMLDIIEAKLAVFKFISKKYVCEFSCATFIYKENNESLPWIHLGSRYNKINKELNIEFDLDLYVS